jgi:mono/diheme cytochrome c family protein
MSRPILAWAVFAALSLTATAARAQSPPYPQIERGRYLAILGDCTACHTAPGAPAFSGGLRLNTPFGTIYSSNITPDPATGIGLWTADDLWHVLHKGHRRDGGNLYPAMPYPWMTRTTRADSDAIFAYLRTLPAVARTKPANDLIPPLNLRVSVSGWNLLFLKPETFTPNPHMSAAWNRGAYIVTGLGHCGACHTKLDLLGAAEDSHALQGNRLDGWYAPDITGNRATGLGSWSEAEIVAYLRTGRNARAIAAGPMAEVVTDSTQHMTLEDLQAIATYLHSMPGPANSPPAPTVEATVRKAGLDIYRDNCAACHGATGAGAAELIPSLIGDGAVVGADPIGALHVRLHGATANHTRFAPTDPGMPAFDWKLSDAQVAAVATFIRTSWGNQASVVSAGVVRDTRRSLRDAGAE